MTERGRQQIFATSKWMNCFFKKCVCFLLNFLVVKKSWCFSLRVVCCLNIWMYLLRNKICQRYHAAWFQSFLFFVTYFLIWLKSVHKLEISVIWYWFSNGIILLLLYYYFFIMLMIFVCLFYCCSGLFNCLAFLLILDTGSRLLCVCAYEWMLFVNYRLTYVVMWN